MGLSNSRNKMTGAVMTKHRGFTLIEILVVLAIIAVLTAILLPVLSTVREKGRSAVCQSNLRQIGTAITLYTQDYDRYPRGLDAADKNLPQIWGSFPGADKIMAESPMLTAVLDPYVKNSALWNCPSDSGYDVDDHTGYAINARPTAFQAFGLSYSYRTELTLLDLMQEQLPRPAETNVLNDSNGSWHGSNVANLWKGRRYNMLFADGHVKSVDAALFQTAWDVAVK
jgi:prepilin-type N-terminal cleavage/methylation domain-containing protein/prepilin-type processing-associated H-X9-DG protein